jgi:hypothetical protein
MNRFWGINMKTWIVALATTFFVAALASAAPVDDGNGREWRQLTETVNLSWSDIATVCPQDGVTPCNGFIGKTDFTGWVWGTQAQVRALLSRYSAALLTTDFVENTGAGGAFLGEFAATQTLNSGPNTCTYCFPPEGAFANGFTASKNASSVPIAAGGNWWIQFLVGFGDGLGFSALGDARRTDTGAFLWRPTGAGTGLVIANDDSGSVPTSAGGQVVANVLANDKNNGAQATLANVTLSLVASSKSGLTLNAATGEVRADASVGAGTHSLLYRICSTTTSSCDEGLVTAFVPATVIRATNDSGSIYNSTGGAAIANVLANDTLGGAMATLATVTLTQISSTSANVALNTTTGSIDVVQAITPSGYSLVYRICERANPSNCAQATATVNVLQAAIVANADSGGVSGATGGVAIANVLTNDTLGAAMASASNVILSFVSSSNAGVSLNTATGAVSAAKGLADGGYTLVYRICERAVPSNCTQAATTVTVRPNVIDAVADYGRGSSKSANTPIPNVLANDSLNSAPATTANVRITVLSALPQAVAFDTATGAIRVTGKSQSGTYSINYRICEIASPTNCAQATVTLDLSGKG